MVDVCALRVAPRLRSFVLCLQRLQAEAAAAAPQLLDCATPVASARRLWDAEAAAVVAGPPAADFAQRIACEKQASKVRIP